MAMTPELKSKWIEALRSGEYKQTTGVLKSNDGFCCLGVLCDVTDNSKWFDRDDSTFYGFASREDDTNLPTKELKELGLDKRVVHPHSAAQYEERFETVLIDLNDTYSNSFNEIADYIEANL